MIDHTGINVSDINRSKSFYGSALAPLGYTARKDFGVAVGFGTEGEPGRSTDPGGDFWISAGPPHEPRPHFAFSAANRSLVDACHKAALAAGASDNGAPGLRTHYHADYYAAYVLDPDGYNIEFVCHLAG